MFLIFAGVIVSIMFWSIFNRLAKIDKRLGQLENNTINAEPSPIPLASEVQDSDLLSGSTLSPHANFSPNVYKEPEIGFFDNLITWIKQDFMVKLGGFLLLLAFGWFVSYSFTNWIGPIGQISLSLLMGTIFILVGTWRIRKFIHQGGIFNIIGVTIILLTTYAAREIYDFFTPETALVLMFLAVSFVAFVSVRYGSEWLSIACLIMAGIAPLLTNSPFPDVTVVFPYLLVITTGTLWVVWHTGWTKLTLISLVVSYLHSLPFLFLSVRGIPNRDMAIMFSFLLVGIFFVANVVSLVRRRTDGKHIGIHALTALGTAIFLFSWIETAVVPEWRSLLYVAWALVFSVGTYVVFTVTANYKAFYIYGSTAVALIAIATAVELDGPTLTITYLMQISALVLVAYKFNVGPRLLSHLSWLYFVPLMMSLESLDGYRWDGVFHEHFVVVFLIVVLFGVVGLLMYEKTNNDKENSSRLTAVTLLIISGIYASALVWLMLHEIFTSSYFATMISLFIYTLVGIAMFVYGRTHNNKVIKICGSLLIAFVTLRLLMIDVWMMETVGKIITFLLIGGLLISTAFINKLQHNPNEQSIDDVN